MQQYKYIKGGAEDFLGAPDWALESVWCDKGGDQMVYWLNKERGLAMMPLCPVFEWNGSYGYRCFVKAHREPLPEWNGDGLPPVGIECEVLHESSWIPCVIVSHYDGFAFAWNYDKRITITVNEIKSSDAFRPLRTEAERKREEAVASMINIKDGFKDDDTYYHAIYDAIAAGKIPGIKLD